MERTSRRNNNTRKVYTITPGIKGIVERDPKTLQPTGNVIQPSGNKTESDSIYHLYLSERKPNILLKNGIKYKQNISTFSGNQLINDYNKFITELSNMKQHNFFNDLELEELLLVFAMTINVSYTIKSNYDLSRLYTQGFFEEKIEKLNHNQSEKLKEICENILYFLNKIQYNYFDENQNINGTQQKDIDLFKHVIKILEEKDKIQLSEHYIKTMKGVNSSMKKNP